MRQKLTSALEVAHRFLGEGELPGEKHHPLIQWGFMLCHMGADTPDEVAWCSAGAQIPAEILGLPRSGSAAARSWLTVGTRIELEEAEPGFDVVVLKRGSGLQPGPEVLTGPGHVGYFERRKNGLIWLCGGNQGDKWTVSPFDERRLLGVQRLA